MRIAGFEMNSVVDGPGCRNTVFFQGCSHDCPGCHNPQTHSLSGGTEMSVEQVAKKLLANGNDITVSGGDPFFQPCDLLELLKVLKQAGRNIWVYTGFLYEHFSIASKPFTDIFENLDVLVDGPFVLQKKTLELPFRGSGNQRLIDMPKTLKSGKVVLWEYQQTISELNALVENVDAKYGHYHKVKHKIEQRSVQ